MKASLYDEQEWTRTSVNSTSVRMDSTTGNLRAQCAPEPISSSGMDCRHGMISAMNTARPVCVHLCSAGIAVQATCRRPHRAPFGPQLQVMQKRLVNRPQMPLRSNSANLNVDAGISIRMPKDMPTWILIDMCDMRCWL